MATTHFQYRLLLDAPNRGCFGSRPVEYHLHLRKLVLRNLDDRTGLFCEQCSHQILSRSIDLQGNSQAAGKHHLGCGREQATVTSIVIGEQHATLIEFLNRGKKALQQIGIVEVGRIAADAVVGLRETRSAQAVLALPEVQQQQVRRFLRPLQLRRQVVPDVGHRCKGRHDQ